MAALRGITTTVLEPPALKTLELVEYEAWVTIHLPNYYRLAKGDDRLPLEEVLMDRVFARVCTLLKKTKQEFAQIGVTTALPRGDDDLKLALLDSVVCPFTDQLEAIISLRLIKMSPSGDSLTSFMEYNDKFRFWNRIVWQLHYLDIHS